MQSNIQNQESKKDSITRLIERNPCAKCRTAKIPKCVCLLENDGCLGEDDWEEDTREDEAAIPMNVPSQLIDKESKELTMPTQAINSKDLDIQFQQSNDKKMFNSEIISELLSKKLLVIDNNKDCGILTIKLQCNAALLWEKQRNELIKFINTLLKELEDFKVEHNISINCAIINKDNESNIQSLCIALPMPKIYDGFIQRLANKNLLPIQNIKQQVKEKIVYEEGVNHFNLNPFLIKPVLAMTKQIKTNEEEEHEKAQKVSFIRP